MGPPVAGEQPSHKLPLIKRYFLSFRSVDYTCTAGVNLVADKTTGNSKKTISSSKIFLD